MCTFIVSGAALHSSAACLQRAPVTNPMQRCKLHSADRLKNYNGQKYYNTDVTRLPDNRIWALTARNRVYKSGRWEVVIH